MKKLLFPLLMLLCISPFVDAKEKTIKYGKNAFYVGEVSGKEPMGPGTLTIQTIIGPSDVFVLSGQFNGSVVTDGEMRFPNGYAYQGDISYLIAEKNTVFSFVCSKGAFYDNKAAKMGEVIDGEGYSFTVTPFDNVSVFGEGTIIEFANIDDKDITEYNAFANCGSFDIQLEKNKFLMFPENWQFDVQTETSTYTLKYENGVTIFRDRNNSEKWSKPNGDFLVFNKSTGQVVEYNLSSESGLITDGKVDYIFKNGNKFNGWIDKSKLDERLADYHKFLGLYDYSWDWSDVLKYATVGKLVFADGSYYEGVFNSKASPSVNSLPEAAYDTGMLYEKDGTKKERYENGVSDTQKEKQRVAYEELKKQDRFELTEKGDYFLYFRKTFPDLTVLEIKSKSNGYGVDVESGTYTYADGTILDFSNSGKLNFYAARSVDVFRKVFINTDVAPSFNEFEYNIGEEVNPYFYTIGVWRFSDGATIEPAKGWAGNAYGGRWTLPALDNGDFLSTVFGWVQYFVDVKKGAPNPSPLMSYNEYQRSVRENQADIIYISNYYVKAEEDGSHIKYLHDCTQQWDIVTFRKTTPEYVIIANRNNSQYNLKDGEVSYSGEIQYTDGSSFSGDFLIEFKGEVGPYLKDDRRIKSYNVELLASLENIYLKRLLDGRTVNENGDIIAVYEKGEKLDEIGLAQYIAREKHKIEQQQKEIAEAAAKEKKYEDECKRYGKKYVDAILYDNTILVGTPEELLLKKTAARLRYETTNTRTYHIVNLVGDTVLSVDVNNNTKRVTFVSDWRN